MPTLVAGLAGTASARTKTNPTIENTAIEKFENVYKTFGIEKFKRQLESMITCSPIHSYSKTQEMSDNFRVLIIGGLSVFCKCVTSAGCLDMCNPAGPVHMLDFGLLQINVKHLLLLVQHLANR